MAVCQLHNPQGIVGMHDLVDDPWLQLSKKLASEAKWRETINSVYSWTNIILNSIDSHFGSKCMYIGETGCLQNWIKMYLKLGFRYSSKSYYIPFHWNKSIKHLEKLISSPNSLQDFHNRVIYSSLLQI